MTCGVWAADQRRQVRRRVHDAATAENLRACGRVEKDFAGWWHTSQAWEHHLRYFIAVAETGSLTEAAERRLHTSQPSLSRQIRDLEYEVGVELLSRGARGVELTVAGKVFLDHARLALMQVDAAVEAARRAAQPASKTFAIGFQTGHEMNWLPRAMHLLPWSVFSRPLEGEAPTIDLAVGYSKANTSPILKLFLSRIDQLKTRDPQTH